MDQLVLTDDLPQKGLRLMPQCWMTFKSLKYSHTHTTAITELQKKLLWFPRSWGNFFSQKYT